MVRVAKAQQWLSLLQTLTAHFSRALTPREIAQVIVDHAKPAVGAHLIVCVLVAEDGQSLQALDAGGVPGALMQVYGRLPFDSPTPLAEMARTGEPIWIETQAEYIRQYPTMETILRDVTKSHAMAALPLVANNRLLGGLGVSFPESRTFTRVERGFFIALAQQCAQALDRARVYEEEHKAREAAEAARARVELLQGIVSELVKAQSIAEIAEVFLAEVLPIVGAQHGSISLLSPDRTYLEFVGNPRLSGPMLKANAFVPMNVVAPGTDAVRTQTPIWIESQQQYAELYPHRIAWLQANMNFQAAAYLPLLTEKGVIGGIALAFEQPRVFTLADRKFLLTVVGQCAQALDRARVYEAERQARQAAELTNTRLELLHGIAGELVKAQSATEIAAIFLNQALPVIGAFQGSISLLNADKTYLEWVGQPKLPPDTLTRFPRLYLTMVNPGTDAVRRQQPIWVQNLQEFAEQYPGFIDAQRAASGMQAGAYLPLKTESGTMGMMGLGFDHPHPFAPEERRLLLTIAGQCAQALDRARAYEAERAARLKAEESDRLKTQFLAMVSHELRTPLTSILGFSSTLLAHETLEVELQQRFMGIIDEEAQRMKVLVDQLIDLSRLQGGVLELTLEAVQLAELVAGIEAQLRMIALTHDLRLSVSQDLPAVRADRLQVEQVLFNLVSNAAIHAPDSTPISIDVRAAAREDGVQVEVCDEGTGIPEAMWDEVFLPFKQLPQKRHTARKGLGLGLTICRALVEAHGGKIWIESNQPQGTRIVFTLRHA
ncbi:MAG: GAF domain-containing protein [Chloroflexi bacterium]|nr:GAF domain-containing protein [Chloroflexota bacterium]